MHHFVRMLEEYIMTEVIEAEWTGLRKRIDSVNLFEDLVVLHN